MADDNQPSNPALEELGIRLAARDKVTLSPEQRAGTIYKKLKEIYPDITNWDLVCFCAEFLGSQIEVYPWLEVNCVQQIARRVNAAHYMREEIPESGLNV